MKTLGKTTLLFVCFFVLFACSAKKEDLAASLTGNWLILYPDHKLTTLHQREVYGHHQDSLVSLYGLKLITLNANGEFTETDSLQKPPGKWIVTPDSLMKIREGGRGFNPFNTSFTGFDDSVLRLTQYVPLEGEKIKLVWHLKKIESSNAAATLFTSETNVWRKKPTVPESEEAIRQRLIAILDYYGLYFALIAKEARYFSPARLPLPFRYYQHAINVKPMSLTFQSFFYNEREAAKAYALLEQALFAMHNKFPRAENFGLEYGRFLKMLADWLRSGGGK